MMNFISGLILLLQSFPGPGMPASSVTTPPASGMLIWYAADSGANCGGACTDGATQTSWADKSVNANNANNGTCGTSVYHTNQINGLPAVTFSSSCFRLGSSIATTSSVSVFAVVKLSSTAAKTNIISSGSSSAGLAYWMASSGKLQGADKSCIALLGNGTTAQNTSWNQINLTYDLMNIVFRLNRAADGSVASTTATTANESMIGQSACGTPEFLSGQLAEILVYSRVLSGGEITTVESYLNSRYGL